MRIRFVVLVAGLLASGLARAQDPDTASVRSIMFEAASAILESVSDGPGPLESMLGIDKAASLSYPLDDDERENWQFWPTQRVGLPIEDMSGEQKSLTHALLRGALSSAGYLKVVHIMQLEQILEMLDQAGFPRAVDHYRLVFFGAPSPTEPWAWRFEGHHVSLSVVVSPDGIRVTPSFLGSNPAQVVSGPLTGFRVHGTVEDLARELVQSLSDAEHSEAVLSDTAPGEIFTATLRKDRADWDAWRDTLQPEGIAVSELNEMQRHWVDRIVIEAIGNYRPEVAARYFSVLDRDSLRFAWMGSTESGRPHYFRLQGSSFLYEYDNVQNSGNHVHAVWRDKATEFGRDVLAEHYRTSHLR